MIQRLKDFVIKNPVTNHLVTKRMIEPIDPTNPPDGFKKGKFIIFIGGGKGSGKSTLLDTLFRELADEGYESRYIAKIGSYTFAPILDAPLMRTVRPHLNKLARAHAHNPDSPSIGHQLVDDALQTAISQESPIIVDYHMDDEKYVDRVMATAKAHGYESILIAPHISAENYFSRVANRQKQTGRPFNTTRGLSSHKGFAERIDRYIKQFDMSVFLSNDKDFLPPTPIAIATPHSMEIFDEPAFRAMHRKASLNIHARTASELYAHTAAISSEQHLLPIDSALECGAQRTPNHTEEPPQGQFVSRFLERLAHSRDASASPCAPSSSQTR